MLTKIKFLFFGIVSALGALVAETVLSLLLPTEMNVFWSQPAWLLLLFVLTEELSKFFVIYKAITFDKFFAPSFLVSLGFASTEITLAFFSGNNYSPFRLMEVFIVHLITGIISGFAIFQTKKTNCRLFAFFGLLAAIVLHLAYNVAILKLNNN